MKNLDGDSKLEYLRNKIDKNEDLTKDDILSLTFLPLMNTRDSRSERTLKSIELVDKIKNNEYKAQSLSMLYALLEKFGDEISKKKFREVFSMTDIGKMIREDGKIEGKIEGIAEGEVKGKVDTLIKLLIKKFGKISKEYESNIRALPESTIDIIIIDIFELNDLKEIEKYF